MCQAQKCLTYLPTYLPVDAASRRVVGEILEPGCRKKAAGCRFYNLATRVSAVLLLGLSCGSAYAVGNQAKPPGGKLLHVKVRTVDNLATPIAGALIRLWQSGGEGRPWWVTKRLSVNGQKDIHTAKDGSAAISFSLAPNPASYQGPRVGFCLTAQAPKHLPVRTGRIDPVPHDHFEIMLTLRRLVSVERRVVDSQGRPVVGATVFHTGNAAPGTVAIFSAGGRKNETVPLDATEVKTDAQGHFRLDGLPEGKSPVFVTHPGYHFFGQLVDTAPKSQQWEFKLLAADQTPPPLRTLPPLRSHQEELKAARQVIRPLWQAAMKSASEGGKERCCKLYANLEPWAAYGFVNGHLGNGSKSDFVFWELPFLYVADPEEALAALESLDIAEYLKAKALLNTVAQAPRLSPQQKLDLLDRATQHLRATTETDERVFRLSRIATRLFDLGKVDEAKKIIEIVTPTAKQLSPKTDAPALATAGEAISLVDLPAGLQLIRATRGYHHEYYWLPSLFRIAYRIAKQQPAEAERLAAETLDTAKRMRRKDYRSGYHHDPTEEDLARDTTADETRLVPLCYLLVSADAARAERVAAAIQNPHVRAYAMGMVAKALISADRARARQLILRAYDILTEARREPDHRWPLEYWQFAPPTVAAALLPVVEEIDPTLVGECLWRAVSFRLPRPADDYVLALEAEDNDAALAGFVARYDRVLARALLPEMDASVAPLPPISALSYFATYCRLPALAVIDVEEAVAKLRADAASPGTDAGRCLGSALYLLQMLPIEAPHRWDHLVALYDLWIPDNQFTGGSVFSW